VAVVDFLEEITFCGTTDFSFGSKQSPQGSRALCSSPVSANEAAGTLKSLRPGGIGSGMTVGEGDSYMYVSGALGDVDTVD
jgi:hypothetical protein